MKIKLSLLAVALGCTALLLVGAVDIAEAGQSNIGGIDRPAARIKGIVKYASKVINTKKTIKMLVDKVCEGLHKEPVRAQLHRVFGKNGDDVTLANVFVQVSKGVEGKFAVPSEPTVIDQLGCLYTPHVSGVMVGQKLKITNSDQTTHNVKAKVGRKVAFNNASQAGVEIVKTFKKPDLLTLKCDVHSWMTGYTHIVKHPFYAVTGADGTFEILGLEPGTYEVSVWHEYKRYKPDHTTITVEVAKDETKTIEFTYKSKSRKKKQ